MPIVPFDIAAIEEPVFAIRIPDGTVLEFDPWKLQEDLLKPIAEGASAYDYVRQCFGLPTEADASAKAQFTFSRNRCIAVQQRLSDFIEQLPVSKKALSLSQKSNASSVSA